METKQNCPYERSIIQWFSRLALIVFGSVGLIFFNLWASLAYLIYSVLYNFLAFPLKHCQYCYFKIMESVIDEENGKTISKILNKDKWKELYLEKHVDCGKKWGAPNLFILWFLPIVLIIISFFLDYSPISLVSLIGFIVILVIMGVHMNKKVCPTCAIKDECHAAF